ncbi:MAG TPA: ATP-binding protein [Methanocorpusculum sp.]|nr:ATP-binding protein [Methanocorpusculum sp.]
MIENFIGREKDLQNLEDNYHLDHGFVVLYGRRRVGKTTLIQKFIEDKSALYFFATEETEAENRKNFADSLAAFTGHEYLRSAAFPDWESLFRIFAEYAADSKKILVIDEFQNLASVNPAFASVFQKIWDGILSNYPVMVILCGSYIRMMTEHTLSAASPLFGRRTGQILLKPLTFYEYLKYFSGRKSFDEIVTLYALTGGVPKYLEFFDNRESIWANLKKHVLNPGGYLYEEPVFLLQKEVSETITYFSILKAVSLGNRKLSDLASVLEMKANSLSPYLKNLEELRLLERRVPVTELYPEKSRRGLYYITDSFMLFWFMFVYPNRGELERGLYEGVLEKIRAGFVQRFLAFVYEDIAKEIFVHLCDEGAISFSPVKAGSYWSKETEIDIAALDENGRIFAGECKYHAGSKKTGARVYAELVEKCRAEFGGREVICGLFSNSGFDEDVLKNADGVFVSKNKVVKEEK